MPTWIVIACLLFGALCGFLGFALCPASKERDADERCARCQDRKDARAQRCAERLSMLWPDVRV
jgi:hypothetical protein